MANFGIFSLVLVAFIAITSNQLTIRPTYIPPYTTLPPIIRVRRNIAPAYYSSKELNQVILIDSKLDLHKRYERSLDSPSAKRADGTSATSGTRNTGLTHPGYNRRNARSVNENIEPLWLINGDDTNMIIRAPSTGDHPVVPAVIDDVQLDVNRRYVRSFKLPSAKREGGTSGTSSGTRNTGPTHPGYNRRNARSVNENIEPLWLNNGDDIIRAPSTGDYPVEPTVIDDVQLDVNRRYVRSFDSPSAKRGGGTIGTSSGTKNTGPTYPGYNRRNARSLNENIEPLWLNKRDDIIRAPLTGDHPVVPAVIDDVQLDNNRRYVRSLDSPSAKRGGGISRTSSGTRNAGQTHPDHNISSKRINKDVESFGVFEENFRTSPKILGKLLHSFSKEADWYPIKDVPRPTIYVRTTRNVNPEFEKQNHKTIIIPNWNPNARTKPWQMIGVERQLENILL